MCGGTKWIMRSSRTGSSWYGAGAPIASGLKKGRGSFMGCSSLQAALVMQNRSSAHCKILSRAQ